MPEGDANLLKIGIGQMRKHGDIDVVVSKRRGVSL
jgi:hypothetical protein